MLKSPESDIKEPSEFNESKLTENEEKKVWENKKDNFTELHHNYVKEISEFNESKLTTEEKKKTSEKIEKDKIENSKLVKGVFKNSECPGGDVTFAYRMYKGDPVRTYHFVDGQEYTIPLGVARHINRQCKYKKSKYLIDKDGNKIIGRDTPIERYQFISQDYM